MLKNVSTLEELGQIMKKYLGENDGKIGSFEINADSIQFSGKLTFKCTSHNHNYFSTFV